MTSFLQTSIKYQPGVLFSLESLARKWCLQKVKPPEGQGCCSRSVPWGSNSNVNLNFRSQGVLPPVSFWNLRENRISNLPKQLFSSILNVCLPQKPQTHCGRSGSKSKRGKLSSCETLGFRGSQLPSTFIHPGSLTQRLVAFKGYMPMSLTRASS